jgi:hypothetical protein
MPGGAITYQYNTSIGESFVSMGSAVNVPTLPVTLTVYAFGLTGAPTALHIHGPAAVGAASGVLIPLCGPPLSTSCSLPTSNNASSYSLSFQQTFTVQMPNIAAFGSVYVNVHTLANPSGELRAQIAAIKPLQSLSVPISLVPTPTPLLAGKSSVAAIFGIPQISYSMPTSFGQQIVIQVPSVSQTISVPLSFGQEIPQASYTRTYTAVPQVVGVMATATVTATLTASSQAISFSSIPISGLSSPLTAAHIHGPCPDANSCQSSTIPYVLCSGNCPGGTNPIIPAFTVDITQLNSAGVASAAGLYQGIMAGNKLYYLNFHTQM